ncbi:hypothetical protein Tco_0953567 [Tanacetum coccineum]|uniref:Transmembrane protein n=1 Tax=Tanacetum coccineum TaxID=301880 RepID=A0ABQ5E2K5_9ASTR
MEVSSVPTAFGWSGSISFDSFLPSVLLWLMIIVVVVGVGIMVVVIVAVVVVVVESSSVKLSFVITCFQSFLQLVGNMFGHRTANSWNLLTSFSRTGGRPGRSSGKTSGNSLTTGWAYAFHQDKASSVRVPVANVTLFSSAHLLRENTDSVRVPVGLVFLLGLLVLAIDAAYASRVAETLSATRTGLLPNGRVDLTGNEDPTYEDGDIGMGVSLGGGISSGGKKSRESNIGGSENTRDGGTTVGVE